MEQWLSLARGTHAPKTAEQSSLPLLLYSAAFAVGWSWWTNATHCRQAWTDLIRRDINFIPSQFQLIVMAIYGRCAA
jgi:hypothetical protein